MVAFKEQLNNWRSLRSWRPYFLIFVLGFLLYSQTLFFGFTYYDDNELILNKATILQDAKNIGSIFSTDVFFSGDKFYYRPLLNMSFMVDAQFGGDLPFFYHLSNVLLHILAALLAFCLLRKISRRPALAFFMSLIFLVHPISTRVAAWLPGRNDSLLAVCVLASFILFLNFLRSPKIGFYLGYLLFLFLALLTKETAIFLPGLVIFYFWFIDRGALSQSDKFLLVLGSAGTVFIWFLMRSLALGGEPTNYLVAVLNILKNWPAIFLSIGKIIFPVNLSVLPILEDSNLIYGIIISVLLVLACWLSRQRRNNYFIFALAWFLIFLLPSFICLNSLPDFLEHRLYLPSIGLLLVLMEIDWVKNLDFTTKRIKIAAVIILLIFSVLTWSHSQKFSDRLTFWHAAVSDSPHSPLAARNLGAMYYLDGNYDQALVYYHRALDLSPNEAMVHNNIGLIYLEKGDYKQAEEEFKKELSLHPAYDKALFNLGTLYFKTNRPEEAGEMWRQTLAANPYYFEAYSRLLNLQNQLR